jgi:hypothetical protein
VSRRRPGHLDNPAAQSRLKDQERLARGQAAADLKTVLASPAGRRFFWGLLARCQVFGRQLSSNALEAAQYEGQRWVGVGLMVEAQEQQPELYLLALHEATERAQEESTERRAAEATPHPEAHASTEATDA